MLKKKNREPVKLVCDNVNDQLLCWMWPPLERKHDTMWYSIQFFNLTSCYNFSLSSTMKLYICTLLLQYLLNGIEKGASGPSPVPLIVPHMDEVEIKLMMPPRGRKGRRNGGPSATECQSSSWYRAAFQCFSLLRPDAPVQTTPFKKSI